MDELQWGRWKSFGVPLPTIVEGLQREALQDSV